MTKLLINTRLLLYLILMPVCVSCAAVQEPRVQFQTVYQDVYVPVPCDEKLPARPQPAENVELMVINLIEYTQIVELKLKICTGEMIHE